MSAGAISPLEVEKLQREVAERDAIISALRELSASLAGKNEALERVLVNHATEIELLKRKLFGPKSERTGTSELQLTLGDFLADAAALQKKLDELSAKNNEVPGSLGLVRSARHGSLFASGSSQLTETYDNSSCCN